MKDLRLASQEPVLRVVHDDCAGPGSLLARRFQRTVKPGQTVEAVLLSKVHRAIPDAIILAKLLGPGTVLLTMDRVLHNQACELGFKSFTLDEQGELTHKKLHGVRAPEPVPVRGHEVLKEDYAHPFNPVASALKAGLAERAFKRYRTRRRRIRSYFGSDSNLSQTALTVGSKSTARGQICGFFLAAAGCSGVKGIRASEGYALALRQDTDPALCVIHALRDLYLLQLETIPAQLFVMPPDSLAVCQQLLSQPAPADASPTMATLSRLLGGLGSVQAFPCVKGPFFDAMQHKLNQLARAPGTNELVVTDFNEIVHGLTNNEDRRSYRQS